jgi:hypothetical protein
LHAEFAAREKVVGRKHGIHDHLRDGVQGKGVLEILACVEEGSMSDLKPCPSCKGEAEEQWRDAHLDPGQGGCRIICAMCGLSTGWLLSFGSAHAIWNALPRNSPAYKRLVELIKKLHWREVFIGHKHHRAEMTFGPELKAKWDSALAEVKEEMGES